MEFGLTDKESQLYLAAMELGPSPVQKIATHANMNRVSAYAIIDELKAKGLMSTYDEGKKTMYVASDPEALIHFIDTQKQALENKKGDIKNTLPELRSHYNASTGTPIVRYYEGKEAVVGMSVELLDASTGDIFTAYNKDIIDAFFKQTDLEAMRKKRLDLQRNVHVIYTSKHDAFPDVKGRTSYKLPDDYELLADIALFDKSLRFISFNGKVSGILIDDHDMYTTLKTIFRLALERAQQIQIK